MQQIQNEAEKQCGIAIMEEHAHGPMLLTFASSNH